MDGQFSRTELLLGAESMERLRAARVIVFGLGGVGGHAAEALVRSGVGAMDIVDRDTVAISNLNRQLIATQKTIGIPKVDAAAERFADINPDCRIKKHNIFYSAQNSDLIDLTAFDYVLDAIDSVASKVELIVRAKSAGVPIISCMGAGNKLLPQMLEVADIYETSVCPLCRIIRSELKKRGVSGLKVVYSKEPPIRHAAEQDGSEQEKLEKGKTEQDTLSCKEGACAAAPRRSIPGSNAFVPATAGLIMAGEVVRFLAGKEF